MDQPFVEVNCAAIPESLFENELFGHVAGAYTGAAGNAQGKIGAADRGTLFLDEIGEIPLHLQAKLLQVLESKQYFPLGASRATQADVRVIAATNANLKVAVEEKRFREDLYYRLRVLSIRLPSLDERRSDVPELARSFCDNACKRHGFDPVPLSPAAVRSLAASEWRGNVRELSNAVESAVIRAVAGGASLVDPEHFASDEAAPGSGRAEDTMEEATRRFQRDLLQRTLDETDWNVAEAARRLDIARSYAYVLIKANGLTRRKG
jgi:Nif-specific regulatory protein